MDFFELSDLIEKCNEQQLSSIVQIVNSRRKHLSGIKKFSFDVGDSVEFNTRTRGTMTGIIAKIMKKNIKVDCGLVTWHVSPSILKKVS